MGIGFVDLDGVVANFTKAACKVLEIEYPEHCSISYEWLYKEANRPKKEFWKKIRGEEFWTSLEPFPWANEIVNTVEQHCETFRFLSKPTFDPGCYSGKYKWVEKHFPKHIDKLILINGDKGAVCSGKKSFLIDDRVENIYSWEKNNGETFFWPEVGDKWDVAFRITSLKNRLANHAKRTNRTNRTN